MHSVGGEITVANIPWVYRGLTGCQVVCGVSSGPGAIKSLLTLQKEQARVPLSLFEMKNLSFRAIKQITQDTQLISGIVRT